MIVLVPVSGCKRSFGSLRNTSKSDLSDVKVPSIRYCLKYIIYSMIGLLLKTKVAGLSLPHLLQFHRLQFSSFSSTK